MPRGESTYLKYVILGMRSEIYTKSSMEDFWEYQCDPCESAVLMQDTSKDRHSPSV